ncbi:hypothetical protein BTHERMOSOX_137 [Bathymodiolus thermophilus thioautotrophic gill symbiont]|nr:hypothetical protein BTHERMOSOX_137 [Bathymodiolus thermophilus thioautotrophic gill symbiont]
MGDACCFFIGRECVGGGDGEGGWNWARLPAEVNGSLGH